MLKGFIVDDEPLARDELAYLLGRTRQVHIVGEADSLETALHSITEMEPDVVFLDIQLAEDNGMELAKQLSVLEQVPDIVFATAYDEYALQAFEVNALDYILKPFEEERVRKTVDKVMKLRSAREKRAAPSPRWDPIAQASWRSARKSGYCLLISTTSSTWDPMTARASWSQQATGTS